MDEREKYESVLGIQLWYTGECNIKGEINIKGSS